MVDWTQLAQQFAEEVRESTGYELNFTSASLAVLDDLVDEWLHLAEVYSGERPQELDHLTLSVLAYVGETLRRSFGGTWVAGAQQPKLLFRSVIQFDLYELVQQILRREHPPAFARLAQALERELELRFGK